MIGAFEIMFNGVWSILSIPLPLMDNVSFCLWQFFLFIIIACTLFKLLFKEEK